MLRDYKMSTVERAFGLLDVIGNSPTGMRLSDIVEVTGYPKSSTFVVLSVLEKLQVVTLQDSKYFLGPQLVTLGGKAQEYMDLRTIGRPVLEDLSAKTGFTVHMGIKNRRQIIFIEKVDGPGFVRFSTYVGLSQPFHISSLGKAICAFLPEDHVRDLLNEEPLTRLTAYTIVDPKEFLDSLETIRQEGYAVDDEEGEEGVRCIAAPVFGPGRSVVAAVSITALRKDLPVEQFSKVASMVVEAALALSRHLGGARPVSVPGAGKPKRVVSARSANDGRA